MQSQNINPKDVQLLLDSAVLHGVDNIAISNMGSRCFMRLKAGLEQGQINPSDYIALKGIVDRAKKIVMPMDFRLAFAKVPPPEIISTGDIHPFTLLDSTNVGMEFLEMPEEIRTTGRPGSTKTTGACSVLDKSIEAGKSVFVIDSKGEGQFDYLCAKHPAKVLKFRVGRQDRPFFNIWQYVQEIRDYFLLITSRKDSKIVLDAAIEQSENQNRISGAKAITHTQLMKNIINNATPPGFPNIPGDFRRSMFSMFYDIKRSALYPSICCQVGYSLREIVTKGYSAIIDTSAIAGSMGEELLICSLLAALRREIISSPDLCSRPGTLTVFYIDECSYLAAASRVPTGLPSLVHLATLVRSSGISLFCAYHSISMVHPVLNAAAFWIITQIADANDIYTAKRMLSLSEIQAKALTTLPKGIAVMRMGNKYTEPFLITYPMIPERQKMSDAEIDANNAPILASLPAIVPEDYHVIIRVQTQAAATSAPAPSTALDNDYLAILHDLAKRQFLNVTERAASIKLPSGTIMNFKSLKVALDTLDNKYNYCRPLAVQLTARGRPSELWYLTKDGHQAIGSLFKPSRGEYEHDFAKRLIQYILLQDMRLASTLEMALPGSSKPVDVGIICQQTNLKIAIEIPISTFATEPDQVEKDFAAGWDRVIEVCMTSADMKKLTAEFAKKNYPANPRLALCLPADLRSAKSLQEIFNG